MAWVFDKTKLWQRADFRWGITLILCLQYSWLRETDASTWVKPLPVIFWWLVVLYSPRIEAAKWVLYSLFAAFIGDILLDLGSQWLLVATIPFLGSTALLAVAFHARLKGRLKSAERKPSSQRELLLLAPLMLAAVLFHRWLAPALADAAALGAVLMGLSVLLLWRALAAALFSNGSGDPRCWLGVLGCCGIVANYVLYSIDLAGMPVQRDVVIQVYYWGQALAAWSFLRPESSPC